MKNRATAFLIVAAMAVTSCGPKSDKSVEWDTLCGGIFDIAADQSHILASPGDNLFAVENKYNESSLSDVSADVESDRMRGVVVNKNASSVATCSLKGEKFGGVDGDLTLTYRGDRKGITKPEERRSSERILVTGMEAEFYFQSYRDEKQRTDLIFECQLSRKSSSGVKYQVEVRMVDNLIEMNAETRQKVLVRSANREARRIGCSDRIEISDHKKLKWAPKEK